ncbi:MAG: FtsX-like permease family protein [Candidatus Thermoplasmatota archaeon]|uniref:FtsX-like permease family protein n=2 Tax=Candidatus Sysuiplasma superficiale TaxID=2823368 RepID=A0A8J8CDB5_9ARCH|nr:FtsX-like permease family protein [Candidatus Sysuiplasma superficiale]MCL4346725.1 FtsX-like permease family protein [Candidatus Thermoplasmatota archaeon]
MNADASTILVLAFAAITVFSLLITSRNLAVVRLFLRNAMGNRKRMVLIIAGLMIGSAMISGALVMRSSMLELSSNLVALSYGHIDETVTDAGNSLYGNIFNYSAYTAFNRSIAQYSDVAAAVPMIYETVSVFDNSTGVPYQDLGFVGTPWWSNSVLGNFVSINGSIVTSLPVGGIMIDQLAASQLGARAGNSLTVYFGPSVHYTGRVYAVVKDNYRGYFDSGYNIFMRLRGAQSAGNYPSGISMIAVSNRGGVLSSAGLSDRVMSEINLTLASVNLNYGLSLSAHALLADQLNTIHSEISDLADLYLALSLFAVAAGLILVVTIFYMLAEERVKDLGILRAIGVSRSRITGGFISEGFVYTLISSFAGSLLGVAIGFAMMFGFVQLFGQTFSEPVRATGILLSSFTVTPGDIISGFSAGGIATFAVIVIASYRTGRMSVVDAIRRIAAQPKGVAHRGTATASSLILLSLIVTAAGYLSDSLELLMLGISLVILSSFWLIFRLSGRDVVAGIAGLALVLFWGLPQSWDVFPRSFSYSYYIYVESGIFLVSGGILIFFAAEPLLMKLVRGSGRRRGMASLRLAMSFTTQKKVRTAISLALFSFVIFGIVSVSVLGSMLDQAAVQTVAKQSGGYNFVLYSGDGANITSTVEGNSTLSRYISEASLIYDTTTTFTAGGHGLFIYPLVGITSWNGSSSFFVQNRYRFYSYLPRYASGEAVWNAVRNNSSLAVVDMTLAGVKQGDFAQGIRVNTRVGLGQTVTVYGINRTEREVTVIGILDEFGFQGVFANAALMGSLGLKRNAYPVLFIRIARDVSPTAASIQLRKALTDYNPVLLNLNLIAEQLTMDIDGIVEMTEIFIAMGLVAGTAGLGIIAMRSVTERYQSIGLLRALGFTRKLVSFSFLSEFIFIALSGSAIGVVMSLINGNIIAGRLSSLLTFTYSAVDILLLVALSVLLTVLAVLSSVKAVSAIEPSASLRYIE